MERRRAKEKATSSDEDYGFWNPIDVVESLYWESYGANGAILPDEAGQLDQDEHLRLDKATYGWLVGFAENILDRDEAVSDALKKAKNR